MPTDPAILAQLQTLWGEPVTEITPEVDGEAAFVPSEWQPSPIPPARSADSPASWDADATELIDWFQANRDRLPVESFCLWPGAWVVDAALFYRSLDGDIASAPEGPRGRYGGLAHDLKCLRKAYCLLEPECRLCTRAVGAAIGTGELIMQQLGIKEIRDNLADALNRVAYAGERVVLARRGKGVAALVSMDDLDLLEKLEDEADVRDAKRALAEMKRKGQKGTPLSAVKKRLGMK